jgi:hypothetical protein
LKGIIKVRRRASLKDMETAIGEGAVKGRRAARRR